MAVILLENKYCTEKETMCKKDGRPQSSLENYTSNNTRQHDTTRVQHNTTQHEYNTTQHDTTRVKYDTTRVQHNPTRVQRKLGHQK